VDKISTCLWFDGNAEEAARFYTSVFPNSRVDKVVKSPANTPGNRIGDVLTVDLTLDVNRFVALNGGPEFRFNESISFMIDCKDQAEVDRYWDALIQGGGEHSVCGWLKDRYGVSWQVVPASITRLMTTGADRAERVMTALLKMKKLDIAALERAHAG